MKNLIGTTAGKIWNHINDNGPVTTLKLKSLLGISNSLLYLSLGWLSRENKIEIMQQGNTFKINLKEN